MQEFLGMTDEPLVSAEQRVAAYRGPRGVPAAGGLRRGQDLHRHVLRRAAAGEHCG